MTNGRKTQGPQKEERTDEEKTERGKDIEHEICVVTRNVNKSSAQYDFSWDMAQNQAKVVMCQGTQNSQDDGTAEKLGWTVLIEENDGKAAIAVKRRNLNLLRDSRKSTRWILVVLGGILFL